MMVIAGTQPAVSGSVWSAIRGAGSNKTPVENLSLAAEVFIVHERFDAPSAVQWAEGMMVNRHIWPGRSIRSFSPVGRDSKGEDETPAGTYISLASQPLGKDNLGGELPPRDENDKRSVHQREWDYLAGHVEKAYEFFRAQRAQRLAGYAMWLESAKSLSEDSLSEWERFLALAEYAARWKMRQQRVHPSFHPVDVLYNGSYCTGAANVLLALAWVAGFEARGLHITMHSMVELRVNGKWIWVDNSATVHGPRAGAHSYAELTAEPSLYGYAAGAGYLTGMTARYRSPYHYAGAMYWHFCGGFKEGRGARDDVADGYGLTVPYDASTATALYPELRLHCFHVPKGWRPVVNLSEKGAFVRCSLDGHDLGAAVASTRFGEPTIDFKLPAALLTAGEHELLVRCTQKTSDPFVFYPDPVEPYNAPVSGKALTVADNAFSVEPVLSERQLRELLSGTERM